LQNGNPIHYLKTVVALEDDAIHGIVSSLNFMFIFLGGFFLLPVQEVFPYNLQVEPFITADLDIIN
jgi:hypothetical protein